MHVTPIFHVEKKKEFRKFNILNFRFHAFWFAFLMAMRADVVIQKTFPFQILFCASVVWVLVRLHIFLIFRSARNSFVPDKLSLITVSYNSNGGFPTYINCSSYPSDSELIWNLFEQNFIYTGYALRFLPTLLAMTRGRKVINTCECFDIWKLRYSGKQKKLTT